MGQYRFQFINNQYSSTVSLSIICKLATTDCDVTRAMRTPGQLEEFYVSTSRMKRSDAIEVHCSRPADTKQADQLLQNDQKATRSGCSHVSQAKACATGQTDREARDVSHQLRYNPNLPCSTRCTRLKTATGSGRKKAWNGEKANKHGGTKKDRLFLSLTLVTASSGVVRPRLDAWQSG